MSLPFLPGLSLNPTRPRPRKQFFSRDDGVTAENAKSTKPLHKRPTAFGSTSTSTSASRGYNVNDVNDMIGGDSVPAWLAFAGQALRFKGYFQEAVTELADEHFKVRKVIIVFHLEDDSISVVEPPVVNSGQPHGVIVRRHRIPLPSDQEDFYMPDDFAIGEEVEFYGRKYRIVDCDEFTRNFYRRSGVELGEKEDYPEDQHSRAQAKREAMKRRVTAPKPEIDAKAQFLLHDKDVLEFYCKWDEKRMFAEPRKFRLQYFLTDDQIQLVEVHKPNSGRDQSGPFLRKQKLRKPPDHGRAKSMADDPVGPPVETYHWRDLRVGERIDVLGRPFLLYDCDERTRRFYKEQLKIVFQPLTLHERPRKEYPVADPPYNGWGSEEDSLLSSRSLVPQPPKQDVAKLLKNDRQVTRFAAKLVSRVEEDMDRDFVVTYYLMDDTIGIYEPAKRNSGMVSGKFLERQRIKIPAGVARSSPSASPYYCAADLYVGARITVNSHTFVLLETDEFSLNVMETRTAEFPRANLELIHDKLRAFFTSPANGATSPREVFESMDTDGNGFVSMQEFTESLRQLREVIDLSDQEIIHLMRHYDTDGDGRISYQEFSAILTNPDLPLPKNEADIKRERELAEPPNVTPDLVRDSIKDSIKALDESLRARKGQLLASFREFDLDKDSKLSLAEFRRMLGTINLALSAEQRDQLVNHFFDDPQVRDAGAKIGFQRFLVLLQREPTAEVILKGVNAFR